MHYSIVVISCFSHHMDNQDTGHQHSQVPDNLLPLSFSILSVSISLFLSPLFLPFCLFLSISPLFCPPSLLYFHSFFLSLSLFLHSFCLSLFLHSFCLSLSLFLHSFCLSIALLFSIFSVSLHKELILITAMKMVFWQNYHQQRTLPTVYSGHIFTQCTKLTLWQNSGNLDLPVDYLPVPTVCWWSI